MGNEKKLKVYCETTFWSYLNGRHTPLQHIAVKQAATLQWWQDIAPTCEIYVSQYVEDEVRDDDAAFASRRQKMQHGLTPLCQRCCRSPIR